MALTPNERAQALQDEVLKALRVGMAERGIKWFASELNVRPDALHHKVDPEDPGHPLTMRDFFRLFVRLPDPAGVMRPLSRGAAGHFIPEPLIPEGATVEKLAIEASAEFGDIHRILQKIGDPGGPGGTLRTPAELDELDKEAEEAVAMVHQLTAAARRGQ